MAQTWKLVVVESPYAGDVARNTRYLEACLLDCVRRGESPYASHKMLTTCLNDLLPDERATGIEAGLAWTTRCDLQVFYEDLGWSDGMKAAWAKCIAECRPKEVRRLAGEWAAVA